ncbi:MAG: hypothetical protein ACI8RD_005556 [Bacillariaceae sp.]|jgi:hypothetical protein
MKREKKKISKNDIVLKVTRSIRDSYVPHASDNFHSYFKTFY